MSERRKNAEVPSGTTETKNVDVTAASDAVVASQAQNPGESDAGHENADDQGTKTVIKTVPLLPLRSDVSFPQIILPLVVHRDRGIRTVDAVMKADKIVGLVTQRNDETDEPKPDEVYDTLCLATILRMLKFPDGSTRIVAQGNQRARLLEIISVDPIWQARVEIVVEESEPSRETDALVLSSRSLFSKLMESGANIPEELQVATMNTHEPGAFCDLLASGLPFTNEGKQTLLEEANVNARLKKLAALLKREVEMQELSTKIQSEVSGELSRAQRDQYLRQQMQTIRRELGEDELSEIEEMYERIETQGLSEAAAREARRELDRMGQMHPSTPEYHVIRTYLDTLLSMPWKIATEDKLDIKRAKRILDDDHYDLEKVKQRILEYLSVLKLKRNLRGPILCFVGPPGVGKTSLGKSIARTMGRKFQRISLGGVHDEAEIRGHRRTYIGAMPGRIIQAIRKLGSNNPVLMLDEIDKLGSDHRGDPASALLEVLDPEQNNTFRDHYLDTEFDLSRTLFICTANNLSTIPSPLLDRMEVLELSGYSEEEKIAIAHKYLAPKQIQEHGLTPSAVKFTDDAIREVIKSYTHEAGLRNLEREVASICRKVARNHAEGNRRKMKVDAKRVLQLLGAPKFLPDRVENTGIPGAANGLAWTPVGGEVMTIECVMSPGKKESLKLTGSLGDVMKESAHAALGYLRAHRQSLKIGDAFFDENELHIHVPAGAISKDGPSAGVALTAGVLSLAMGKPIRPKLAMSGEITLTGRVLPVGGIREKVLAARREGLTTVILPINNEKDTQELPDEVRNDLTFIFVRHMDDVVPHLFSKDPIERPKLGKAKVIVGRRPLSSRPRVPPVA